MKPHRSRALFALQSIIAIYLIAGSAIISSSAAVDYQADSNTIYLPIITNNQDTRWHWLEPTQVTLTPSPNTSSPIFLAVDPDRRIHILWDTINHPRFIYHTFQSETGWSEIRPIAQTLGTSKTLSPPIIDSHGNLHLVWKDWLGFGVADAYRLMYATFASDSWSSEEEVWHTENSYIQGMPQFDNPENVLVTLLDSNYLSSFIIQTERGDGSWTKIHSIDPQHPISLVWPDLRGGVHIYGDEYPDQLNYSYWRNDVFEVDNRQIGGQISYHDTQLDGMNNLHVFWNSQVPVPGGTVNGIYYDCLAANSNWAGAQVITGEDASTGGPLKASDGVSRVALGWEGTPGHQLKLMISGGVLNT